MADLLPYTRIDKVRELKREIGCRETVYGRMVNEKRMRESLAEYRISLMKAILADYEAADDENLGPAPAGHDAA